ncbi:MAG: hypothetical protein R2741_10340 [Methanolobus sp.]
MCVCRANDEQIIGDNLTYVRKEVKITIGGITILMAEIGSVPASSSSTNHMIEADSRK